MFPWRLRWRITPGLEPFRLSLPEYTEFAVRLRYDDLPWLTREEASEEFAVVGRLRDVVGRWLAAMD